MSSRVPLRFGNATPVHTQRLHDDVIQDDELDAATQEWHFWLSKLFECGAFVSQ